MSQTATAHIPVMIEEVMDNMQPRRDGIYVDATFGGGGYTAALLEAGAGHVVAIDRDPQAIARGQGLKQRYGDRLSLVQGRFSDMADIVKQQKGGDVDAIVMDLGFSSDQLDEPERGFSYQNDGPLDMRMTPVGETAADVLNTYDEKDIANILFHYGEERKSRQIAKRIVAARKDAPITRTSELTRLVEEVNPPWKGGGRHPAMRTFQALRIHVNREIEELEAALPMAADLLKPRGRLCVVSFHSLEDRAVKHFFRQLGEPRAAHRTYAAPNRTPDHHERAKTPPVPQPLSVSEPGEDTVFALPFRRALRPTEAEVSANPRARSARLRVLMRIDPDADITAKPKKSKRHQRVHKESA